MKKLKRAISFTGLVLAPVVLLTLVIFRSLSFAQQAAPPKIDTGDTAWMLTSAALVLMMTIPVYFSSMAVRSGQKTSLAL
jgi:Amt family ammonium transporter